MMDLICTFYIKLCHSQIQNSEISRCLIFSFFGHSKLFWWISSVPMVLYALLIVTGDKYYRILALYLNDLGVYLSYIRWLHP